MKNSIVIGVEFSFKGKTLSPSMVVDLDVYIQSHADLAPLYPELAKNNDIDMYSYEYEMMQMESFVYSDATGLASIYLENGKFDFDSFKKALNDENISERISVIAKTHLSIDDLDSQPDIKAALTEAFLLGKKSS